MKPQITVITIGVDDLEASLRFYRGGLGFFTEGIMGQEFECGAVVFIELQPSLRSALWSRKSIAHDTRLAVGTSSPTEMTLGHNVSSKTEVDAVMARATSAGAFVVKPAHDTFWGGYSGYFQDPTDTFGKLFGIRNAQSEVSRRHNNSFKPTAWINSGIMLLVER